MRLGIDRLPALPWEYHCTSREPPSWSQKETSKVLRWNQPAVFFVHGYIPIASYRHGLVIPNLEQPGLQQPNSFSIPLMALQCSFSSPWHWNPQDLFQELNYWLSICSNTFMLLARYVWTPFFVDSYISCIYILLHTTNPFHIGLRCLSPRFGAPVGVDSRISWGVEQTDAVHNKTMTMWCVKCIWKNLTTCLLSISGVNPYIYQPGVCLEDSCWHHLSPTGFANTQKPAVYSLGSHLGGLQFWPWWDQISFQSEGRPEKVILSSTFGTTCLKTMAIEAVFVWSDNGMPCLLFCCSKVSRCFQMLSFLACH